MDDQPEIDERDAVLSEDGRYRYVLTRRWGPDPANTITWVALNPSVADATQNDPTVVRMIGYSRREGYDGLHLVNLFALRSTDPDALMTDDDPVGPENDAYLEHSAALSGGRAIATWGAHRFAVARAIAVADGPLRGAELMCLGTTQKGHPRHPLYLPLDAPLVVFREAHPILREVLDDRA